MRRSARADPWLHRTGGGIEYHQFLSRQLSVATGFNYQVVSVRPGAFTIDVEPEDEFGNPVTVSEDGQDTLFTYNFAGLFTNLDDLSFPTSGSRLRFGLDVSIPVGDADILFGRFATSLSQFIPLNLFGFSEGPRTLILGVQTGTIIGDVPPYEAFSMGGSRSIRGYNGGEVSTSSSFIVTSVEYRFPVASDLRVLVDFDLQGTFFFDYGTDFGTADDVIGEPGCGTRINQEMVLAMV
ncbi:BamA/TamA family outer membrane protein [bacterium]|nr:BamA/TamA family outer membrane protein [bacterium]